MKWLKNLLGSDSEESKPAPAPIAAPAPSRARAPERAHAGMVDVLFYRWLAGVTPNSGPSSDEKILAVDLAYMTQLPLDEITLAPSRPPVFTPLLRSMRDSSVSGADLARQLSQDKELVAEVLREANRPCHHPHYHANDPVTTVERATMLLGVNGLRMLVGRASLLPVIMSMHPGPFSQLSTPLLWRQCEKCALAASVLAPSVRANPVEAYFAGLLHNMGLIVAFRLLDQANTEPSLPQSEEFVAALHGHARVLSVRIAEAWGFPETVTSAIREAGDPDGEALSQVVALADMLSRLRMLVDSAHFEEDDPFVVEGLDAASLACFEELRNEDE
ncbi:HDOD domain-containing protein [Massilia sp. CCM 8734]|uniref:HDOD domain-containing protein n=1 Tax=Massilia sp. CCM 8734 TaxID=2609283 RepID=UPI001421AA51|nr:HDOD domain-containing protein [Massilia sp. CCM 8734]NHZ94772.1 HDOD domain-containing protein [Massilia sp. CCM 8734]